MNKNVTRQSGPMPFGTGLGRVFQKKGRSSSHPIGSCGRLAGVRTPICRVRRNRRAGRSSSPPLGLRKRCGEGTSTARIYRQCLELPKKVARSFSLPLQKTFVFRRNVLKIISITFLLFPTYIALVPQGGEKEGKKKRKTGKKSTNTPLFCRFLPRFLSCVSVFLFAPAVSVSFLRGRRQWGANFQVPQGALSSFFVYLHDHVATRRSV